MSMPFDTTAGSPRRRRPPDAPPCEFDRLLAHCAALHARRYVLVSNDPRLMHCTLAALALGPDDVLVQFNQAVHRAQFDGTRCHRWHVFNRHGAGNWGCTAHGVPDLEVAVQDCRSLTFLFPEGMDPTVAQGLATMQPPAPRFAFYPEDDLANEHYPQPGKMSAGFAVLCLLRRLFSLQARVDRVLPHIDVVGFSGESVENGRVVAGWGRHDFDYEQRCIARWRRLNRIGFGDIEKGSLVN